MILELKLFDVECLHSLPSDGKLETSPADCIEELLARITSALADLGVARFSATIAGERWRTDVRTDLLTLLEQLACVLRDIAHLEATAQLDFYEQGIERFIRIERRHDILSLAVSGGPKTVLGDMPVEQFIQMLNSLWQSFKRLAFKWCPRESECDLFHSWTDEIERLFQNDEERRKASNTSA